MKKDRNSFFSEYSSYNNINPMMPNMYPNGIASQSSFYSGPITDPNMMNQNNPNWQTIPNQNTNNYNYTSDIESRISKIERQINRIETRLNKIEGELTTNLNTKDYTDSTYNNNMYMV